VDRSVLAAGLAWPEGPSVLPDGRVVFVETYRSRIGYWAPDGSQGTLVDTGGGPNATVLGSDGYLYVTQNGGVVGPWRAPRQVRPSIQRVGLDGTVDEIATEIEGIRLQAPNDLAFGPDGVLYFTDPGRYDEQARPDPGYIFALEPDGQGRLVERLEPVYPNGIAVEADGSLVWVESYTRRVLRRRADGTIVLLATLEGAEHVPDGLAIAANGDLYVTSTGSRGVDVVSRAGGISGFLGVGSLPTNCVFDGDTLLVTDGGESGTSEEEHAGGLLWRVDLGVAGMPLHPGRIA
jgi:gluconolactonase